MDLHLNNVPFSGVATQRAFSRGCGGRQLPGVERSGTPGYTKEKALSPNGATVPTLSARDIRKVKINNGVATQRM